LIIVNCEFWIPFISLAVMGQQVAAVRSRAKIAKNAKTVKQIEPVSPAQMFFSENSD
jgi:hypothetical protein